MQDLKPVAVASEINKSTESADLELKSEKGEMEVEKLERGNDLGSEERFKGNDAREEIEEETKKEETYQADLHKVETTCEYVYVHNNASCACDVSIGGYKSKL